VEKGKKKRRWGVKKLTFSNCNELMTYHVIETKREGWNYHGKLETGLLL